MKMTLFRRVAFSLLVIAVAWAAPKALRRQAVFVDMLAVLIGFTAVMASDTQANQNAKLNALATNVANAAGAVANAVSHGMYSTGNAGGSGSGAYDTGAPASGYSYDTGNAGGSGSGIYATGGASAGTAHHHDASHVHNMGHHHDASHVHTITL